ncbi:hypothetical protein F4820DRAFT_393084 [Hypoxylon rubiginosum]|uniref:Uncharacterized protein n=1 Tax=Hypoxylon rubiginosum TaxID=110542 RepID=A0ACB9YU87_9PEZI|nr:hypothetical protein F4820DRAFT_393084 [Hypoxylon rubiginosum]
MADPNPSMFFRNTFGSDANMSFEFNNEFELNDVDDSQNTIQNPIQNSTYGPFSFSGLMNYKWPHTPVLGGQKPFPSGSGPAAQSHLNGMPSEYPSALPSHRGSSSSASSSRASGISNSPKTTPSSTDVVMTEGSFPPSAFENGLKHTDSNFMYDTMDPTNMDMQDFFDIEGASGNAPDTGTLTSRGPAFKKIKGTPKTQLQHSRTKSANGFKTSDSRETSPASNMILSQETSPAAVLYQSPPPENHFNDDLRNPNMWSPGMGIQNNGLAPHIGQDPMGHDHPSFPPQMILSQPPPRPRPRLVVHTTPMKSRVETQIPIKLTMHHIPPGIKTIHLPTHTIAKHKLLAKPDSPERSPEMLELYTMLVCTSAMMDPEKRQRAFQRAAAAPLNRLNDDVDDEERKPQNGGEVRICDGCIGRERKRAARKKNRKPEEEEMWNLYEHERAIVFNTNEVKEWQAVTPGMADPIQARPRDVSVPDDTVTVDVPMRIACYCRHHQEKMGFQVIFTIKDYRDNLIAQKESSSIMITDDHKTHVPVTTPASNASVSAQARNASVPAVGAPPLNTTNDVKAVEAALSFHPSHSASDLQGLAQNGAYPFPSAPVSNNHPQAAPGTVASRNGSRQGSPASPPIVSSKKRRASGTVKVPSRLTMTRLDTRLEKSQSPSMPSTAQNESAITSAATSPFSPLMGAHTMGPDPLFHGQQSNLNMGQHFQAGPLTPNSTTEQLILPSGHPSGNRNMSFDAMQMFSAPASAHASRAPSPSRLRNDVQNMSHAQLGQNLYNNVAAALNSNRAPQPMIYKIIPCEGPKSGGIEVTILGSGFTNAGLEVWFGEQRAATTTYWGETSLVCLLPPSPVAGVVMVSIRHPRVAPQQQFSGNQQPLFRYIDDDETRLIRTALTVLGLKMNEKVTDLTGFARDVINNPSRGGSWGPSFGGSQPTNNGFANHEQELPESVETELLRILKLIDMDKSPNKARLDLRRLSGQTMLHLACSLGLDRVVTGLLIRGASVGIRDKGGFTPLHMAAMNDQPEIVQHLITRGADPNMRSLSGLIPADVARSNEVLRVLRRVENHSRSRSSGSVPGSIPSRPASSSSLRSLWDPAPMTPRREEFMSDGLSSVEDSDDSSDDSSDSTGESNDWLSMRRPEFPSTQHHRDMAPRQPIHEDDSPPTPGQSVAALREQFATQLQQWQQSMAMHFQNLPQFQMPHMQMPQMPALPMMPMLPDYQAYLPYSAPVMERISSFVPNIRGPRPGSADGQSPRDADNKWWDRSFFGTKESPPAYEDIFPQKTVDIKQQSLATAVVESAADEKCAVRFDQITSEASQSQSQEVPALLEIGRKSNITKEQQEHLQRAHAQRLKTGSSDKMLWFVWIPTLIFMLGAMLLNGAPWVVLAAADLYRRLTAFVASMSVIAQKLATPTVVA